MDLTVLKIMPVFNTRLIFDQCLMSESKVKVGELWQQEVTQPVSSTWTHTHRIHVHSLTIAEHKGGLLASISGFLFISLKDKKKLNKSNKKLKHLPPQATISHQIAASHVCSGPIPPSIKSVIQLKNKWEPGCYRTDSVGAGGQTRYCY